MVLLRDDLMVVPTAIVLARAALKTIKRNLAWAFGYNIAAVPLAALGFLNPLIAAAAMTMSSVLVVANSLHLRRFRVASSRPGVLPPRAKGRGAAWTVFSPQTHPRREATRARPPGGQGSKVAP